MQKDQGYMLIDALRDYLVAKGYVNDTVNGFPRVEVYLSEGGQQIDKGPNSKPVDIVLDVITNNRNEGEALGMSEALQDTLYSDPVTVDDFNIDLVTMTGTTPLTEENGRDDRTINRILINYNYILSQINF